MNTKILFVFLVTVCALWAPVASYCIDEANGIGCDSCHGCDSWCENWSSKNFESKKRCINFCCELQSEIQDRDDSYAEDLDASPMPDVPAIQARKISF